MDKTINKPILKKKYEAIPSKSILHRALICAAFSDTQTVFPVTNIGDDVLATVRCLEALGISIDCSAGGFVVTPLVSKQPVSAGQVLDCGDSATTYRFMKEIVDTFEIDCELTGSGKLMERVTSNAPTSQTVSGKLLANGAKGKDFKFAFKRDQVSRPYIDMTADVMRHFGSTGYISPGRYIIEGDWSQAAVWMTAAAVSRKENTEKGFVTISGLNLRSKQGDRDFLKILRSFGAAVSTEGNNVHVISGKELRGIEYKMSDNPDLVPLTAVLGSFAKGPTLLTGIAFLRNKESDRIESTADMIRELGGSVDVGENFMLIYGTDTTGGLKGGIVNTYKDHRIAMAAAVAAFGLENEIIIQNAECISKSYPNFWEVF